MVRFAATTIAVFLMIGQVTSASPREDAANIAAEQLTQDGLGAIRASSAKHLVKRFEKPLAALGAKVADPDRFAAMLPDTVTDGSVLHAQEAFTNVYLDFFTPEELSEVAAFLRTDASRRLRAVQLGQPPLNPRMDFNIDLPSLLPDAYRDIPGLLTPEEIAVCESFLDSAAGNALKRNTLGFKFLLAVAESVVKTDEVDTRLNTPYLIRILEADGIVTFPNRIILENVIEQLRNQVQE